MGFIIVIGIIIFIAIVGMASIPMHKYRPGSYQGGAWWFLNNPDGKGNFKGGN